MQYLQHLKANNDINGNPQRLYIIIRSNGYEVKDEGYRGEPQGDFAHLPTIKITVKEYKRLLRPF